MPAGWPVGSAMSGRGSGAPVFETQAEEQTQDTKRNQQESQISRRKSDSRPPALCSIPGRGTKIPDAVHLGQKKKIK